MTPLIIFLAYCALAAKRTLTTLHIYQQEEYDSARFSCWIWARKAFDERLSLHIFLLSLAAFTPLPPSLLNSILVAALGVAAFIEEDPRTMSKKKLVLTPRAKRIFFLALLPACASGVWSLVWPGHFIFWILNVQAIPLWLMVANTLLTPYESRIQKKFWQEAHDKITDLKPTIIGITGSYGKTSVKHILGHILKNQAPTLITPGSVNTPMGITRIIREQLEPRHKYFIVEMGAYGKGSIARICALTPPDLGIITAIGAAHLERFKSLDTTARTKFELAEAVMQKRGQIIAEERVFAFESARTFKAAHEENFITCGESTKNALILHTVSQDIHGLTIDLSWQGMRHTLSAPLYGIHHGHNIALAFAAAAALGISPEDIITALKTLPQITHRLEVKPQNDGTILIDDAYNSNPAGFASALALLPVLAGKEGRKILVTPGMVELGSAHETEHMNIGRKAGEICDIVLLVGGERIPSFKSGFRETGADKYLHEFQNFTQAQIWLSENKRGGDVILLENDLPDVYEYVPKI